MGVIRSRVFAFQMTWLFVQSLPPSAPAPLKVIWRAIIGSPYKAALRPSEKKGLKLAFPPLLKGELSESSF